MENKMLNRQAKPNIQVTIALTDPKTPSNVGSVMRAAGNYNVDQVLFSGKRYAHAAKFKTEKHTTDTRNIRHKIPLTQVDDFINIKDSLENISSATKIICVDLVEGAIPLPHFVHPENALYIFGPEDSTISQEVIDNADDVVYVPTTGCMNLAASVNVLLYDRLAKSAVMQQVCAQSGKVEADNALIRKSRDTNNTVKVR